MDNELDRLLTIDETALVLRIGRTSVYKLMAEGKLPRVRILDRTLIRRDDVVKLQRSECMSREQVVSVLASYLQRPVSGYSCSDHLIEEAAYQIAERAVDLAYEIADEPPPWDDAMKLLENVRKQYAAQFTSHHGSAEGHIRGPLDDLFDDAA